MTIYRPSIQYYAHHLLIILSLCYNIVDNTIRKRDQHIMAIPIYGNGKESVYIYYYEIYYNQAIKAGKSVWPCKVGFSKQSAIHRIEQQVITSSPEKPIIGAIIKVDDGYLLEQALHSILRLFHQELPNATGKEWFYTNPTEIVHLCEQLNQIPPTDLTEEDEFF